VVLAAALALYHNLGGGKFEEVTKKAGLDPSMHALGCTAGDYDNDGATDLALSVGDGALLFHNEKGTFRMSTRRLFFLPFERSESLAPQSYFLSLRP